MLGTVIAPRGAGNFRVRLDEGIEVLCRIAGRMIRFHIRIAANDKVLVELSAYDLRRARIVYRC